MFLKIIKGCGKMNFGRVLTAMVTPFDHQGEVDYPATKNLIDHLIANGTDALVIAGTTGESPTLSNEEKVALFSFAVKEVNGRIPVIAGTGSNNTRESIALTAEAENTGVDGIMLVAPYYNKPNQEGMYQHFKTIAESTSLPVMMYNVPGRTACVINPDTIVRLATDIDNIVSVKEASGNLDAIADIIERTDEDFTLYSGDDGLTLPILAIGGTGIVSVSSHVLGQKMQQMVQAHFAGRPSEAAAIHREILPKCQALFSSPSPTPVKAVLNMAGVSVGDVRLPLVPLSDEEHRELMRKMQLQITRVS